jgi:hypothetical protein
VDNDLRSGYGRREGISFLGALLAVFLAGALSGVVVRFFIGTASTWTRVSLTVFVLVSIAVAALVLKGVLPFMGARISLMAALVTMILGNLLPIIAVFSYSTHSNRRVLPIVGGGFTAFNGLFGIVILLAQAWIVQSSSSAT